MPCDVLPHTLHKLERSVTTPVKECGIDIIWTNRSILFPHDRVSSAPELASLLVLDDASRTGHPNLQKAWTTGQLYFCVTNLVLASLFHDAMVSFHRAE
jgi:hypothetical protein